MSISICCSLSTSFCVVANLRISSFTKAVGSRAFKASTLTVPLMCSTAIYRHSTLIVSSSICSIHFHVGASAFSTGKNSISPFIRILSTCPCVCIWRFEVVHALPVIESSFHAFGLPIRTHAPRGQFHFIDNSIIPYVSGRLNALNRFFKVLFAIENKMLPFFQRSYHSGSDHLFAQSLFLRIDYELYKFDAFRIPPPPK